MRARSITQRHSFAALLAVIVLAGTLLVAGRHAGSALVVSRDVADPDAILVLGSHEWERLPAAAERARRSPEALVLLSVPRVITEQNCHRCTERGDWLVTLGVDATRLRLLPRSVTNTRDEARAALMFAQQHRVQRLLVVTSPYHTRRALATFDAVFNGSGVAIGVTSSSDLSAARPERWWRSPYDRWYVRYEWSAIAFYLMRYGIIPTS